MGTTQLPAPPGGWTFRDGRTGRLGVPFAAVWLVFLVDSLKLAWSRAWGDREQVSGVVGLVALLAFAGCYLAIFIVLRRRRLFGRTHVPTREALLLLTGLSGLATLLTWAIGEAGLATTVYVVVIGVMVLPTRGAALWTALVAVLTELLGALVPGWTPQGGLVFAICTAGFAMWGVQQLMLRNLDLLRAREENARLVIAEERNRFARDLHDILGHSLTVITVKAELAQRLVETEPARARAEIADLERLSRDALADVRRAVEGYRELTLPGELTRARSALAAAGIEAVLPNSTEEVPSALRELFAWTVREGVTNVVRHSRARRCTIVLDGHSVEISDDGRGADGAPFGNGLLGLRERAAAVGATVVTQTRDGHVLKVVA
jgi:two-component system, NarL family, sensor histidine kinase DesK